MKYNTLCNQQFAAIANGLVVPLTVTMEGTGSATAWMTRNMIVIDCVAAQINKYANISTPIDFDLINMWTIDGAGVACAVQACNGASAITDAVAVAGVDTDIDYAGTLDNTYQSFATGDDDLRFEITTGAFTGRIVCLIDM